MLAGLALSVRRQASDPAWFCLPTGAVTIRPRRDRSAPRLQCDICERGRRWHRQSGAASDSPRRLTLLRLPPPRSPHPPHPRQHTHRHTDTDTTQTQGDRQTAPATCSYTRHMYIETFQRAYLTIRRYTRRVRTPTHKHACTQKKARTSKSRKRSKQLSENGL